MESQLTSPRYAITRAEWRFVWILLLVVLLLTSLPYAYGYLTQPEGKQYLGLMQDVPDHAQYLSWWRGFQDSFLVPNKFTPEPNRPIFFNLQWWLLAQLSNLTGWGYPVIYQILRLLGGIFLAVGVYRLLSVLFSRARTRKLTFALLMLSSGFGWLLVVWKYASGVDIAYPQLVFNSESNYFLCLLGYPHFALAAGMVALTLERIFRGYQNGRMRDFVIAGVWAALLSWAHAYDLFIIYGVSGMFFLLVWIARRKFPKRFFWGELVMGLISGWGALYSFLLTNLDPLWKEVLDQFDNAGVFTPAPLGLFVLFGVPLFLAVAGLVAWLREKKWNDERLFLAGWLGVGFVLLYVPTDFQIHMLNTWQIPAFAIAAWLVCEGKWFTGQTRPLLGRPLAEWLPALLVLLVLPTNLYLLTWRFVELSRHTYPYYLEQGYLDAAGWLEQNTQPEEIVLSSMTVGQYLPVLSNNTVYLAHWATTADFYGKEERVERFFQAGTADVDRLQTLSAYGVDYVIRGPAEKLLGDFSPGQVGWLEPVFTSGEVQVYRVLPDKLTGSQP